MFGQSTPEISTHRILVIGAGVVGLTTALCLLQAGFRVTVVANTFSPKTTSNVAGALWEWPPAVCGHHRNPISLKRSKAWCMTSYESFKELSEKSETGVKRLKSVFFFRHPVMSHPDTAFKMHEIKNRLNGFRYGSHLIKENSVNPDIGLQDAYEHLAPVVHTDIYLSWLYDQVRQLGGNIVQHTVSGSLLEQEVALKQTFGAAAIINCAGLGAQELAQDAMYPLRGALIRVQNDGRHFPKINKALSITLDERDNMQNMIYLVPRGDILLLGGLVEKDEWSTDISLENYEPIRQMYQRCLAFLPALKNAKVDIEESVRVGLRPGRQANVCLTTEPGTTIIHNYGHGGSGVTLSWGCAVEVTERVRSLLGQQKSCQLAA